MFNTYIYCALCQGTLKVVDLPIHTLMMHNIRIRINRYYNIWDTDKEGYELPASVLQMTIKAIKNGRFYDAPTLEIEVE